jgi:hypothetical protein
VKRVSIQVRQATSRVPFRSGDRTAYIYEVDADGIETTLVPLYTTRNHETWASAVRRALRKADRMGWEVHSRPLIERKLAKEEGTS